MSLRVVSLLPSATEMVCAVGGGDSLTGVSHECDWPPEVVGRPVLTSARIPASAASGDIDRSVRGVLEDALAVYSVDVDGLREADPDVIVTQDLCDVCAVSLDDVRGALSELNKPGVRVVSLRPTCLVDIWADLERVGEALGVPDRATTTLAALRARVAEVEARASHATDRPRVLTIEWLDPVMIGGLWMPELIELAGGTPLVTRPGQHAPTLDLASLKDLEPDVVLIKPCGFTVERTLSEQPLLRELLSALQAWPAIARDRVWVADGNAYFNRPGPRIVDSLELLAACVHPDLFADHAQRYAPALQRLDELA